LGLRPAPEFEAWLRQMRILTPENRLASPGPALALQRLLPKAA
jgi:ethanolamine ammonia-lyase large subunit